MTRATSLRGRFALALSLSVLASGALVASGCASAKPMQSGAGVPASEGTVKVTEGPNGNTELSIKVKHLARPEDVVSGTSTYVVWIDPAGAEPQSVGAISLDNELEGRLDTVTSHQRFQLIVTPEQNGQVTGPTNPPVFSFYVDRSP